MTIAQEEIFGPVLLIMLPYDDEAEAVRMANDSHYGLSGGVWSGTPERALNVARQLRTGQVDINGGRFNALAPFGGYKRSGVGREIGPMALRRVLPAEGDPAENGRRQNVQPGTTSGCACGPGRDVGRLLAGGPDRSRHSVGSRSERLEPGVRRAGRHRLGFLLSNLLPSPRRARRQDSKFATTTILRAGIVLVGIRLSVFDVLKLGLAGLPVVLTAIVTGLLFVIWFNRRLGLPPRLGTLIAAGTSICGVTAIVSTAPAIEADEREVAYAVANVVAFGLFGMLVYPYLHMRLHVRSETIGLFLGTAVHDTSQVVGAALTYKQVYADDVVLRDGDGDQTHPQHLPGGRHSGAHVDART